MKFIHKHERLCWGFLAFLFLFQLFGDILRAAQDQFLGDKLPHLVLQVLIVALLIGLAVRAKPQKS